MEKASKDIASAKTQVIRELQVSGEVKSSDPSTKKYCLLKISKDISTKIGPMINLGNCRDPQWCIYTIVKKFKSKQDAEEYSKANNVEIVNWAEVD